MNKITNHIDLWRQRLSLGLVLVFCMLVSASEYYPLEPAAEQHNSQEQPQSENSDENQTFLNVGVDALVPFVVGLASQVFHLMYESISYRPPVLSGQSASVPLNFPYWEILLERIISPNAP